MKKYIAKTNVSINVVLSNGTNCHIAFSAVTGGGSVFYTDDAEVIRALETHYKYGKLFRADPHYVSEKRPAKPALKQKRSVEAKAGENLKQEEAQTSHSTEVENSDNEMEPEPAAESETEENEDENNGLKTIVVSDPDAAKSYLAEHFGYSRTKIKTLKAIKEAAAANGIEFDGI